MQEAEKVAAAGALRFMNAGGLKTAVTGLKKMLDSGPVEGVKYGHNRMT